MPFAKLIQPTAAKKYDPKREAMFAQLLARGQAPAQDIGTVIGNLAQQFVGQRGLAKQGQAQQMELEKSEMEQQEQKAAKEAQLAQYLAEKGIDPAALQNPSILGHELGQLIPQEPAAPKPRRIVKGPDGLQYYEDTQETECCQVLKLQRLQKPSPRRSKGMTGSITI